MRKRVLGTLLRGASIFVVLAIANYLLKFGYSIIYIFIVASAFAMGYFVGYDDGRMSKKEEN